MTYTTFNQNTNNALLEPMFMGNSVNVSRYDIQKHAAFEKLIEKQLSFFWRPEEIDVSKDNLIGKDCLLRKSTFSFLTLSTKHY